MSEITLEEHLEEICPKCKKTHNANWQIEFDTFLTYTMQKCEHCNYKIFKKTEIMTHII